MLENFRFGSAVFQTGLLAVCPPALKGGVTTDMAFQACYGLVPADMAFQACYELVFNGLRGIR